MHVRIYADTTDADGHREFTDYPVAALNTATLVELMHIKVHTGLSGARIESEYQAALLQRAADKAAAEAAGEEHDYDLSGDVPTLRMLSCLIWLARRRGGSKATLEDAEDLRMDQWTIVSDEEEGEEQDPPSPGSGGPATPDDAPADAAE